MDLEGNIGGETLIRNILNEKEMKKRWRRNKLLKRRKGNIRNFHRVLHVSMLT